MKSEETLYGSQWRVSINGKYMHKKLKDNIYKARHQNSLLKHMLKKGKIDSNSKSLINWRVIERTGKSLPQHRKTWITKHVSRYNEKGQ